MAIEPGPGPDGVTAFEARRRPLSGRRRLWIIAACIGVAVLAVVLTDFLGKHKPTHTTTGPRVVGAGIPYAESTDIPKPTPARVVPAPQKVVAPAPIKPAALYTKSPGDNALEAPMSTGTAYSGPGSNRAGASRGPGTGDKDDEFTAAMTASGVGAPAKAHRMKHPALTIPAGIIIDCVLQTAINSELMGFVDCILPTEVRSADGTVTLFDKGTQVMGQIKSGLRRGQDRLFILWTRARTPDNVVVDLASPGADELGRAGVDGYVDSHFWRMFWSAALFSLVEYGPILAASALQNHNSGNSGVSNFTTFLTPQQSLAQTILQDELHIPPTLEKNQGDLISVFVARDLDFSSVYDLRIARTRGDP